MNRQSFEIVCTLVSDLGCAEIRSLRLIKLFPLKAILEWQMDSEQKELRIDHFTVKSDHGILVPSCKEKEAQLSLYPGTKYTLTVETHYSGDIMSSSKQEFKYTTPTIDDSMLILYSVVDYELITTFCYIILQ